MPVKVAAHKKAARISNFIFMDFRIVSLVSWQPQFLDAIVPRFSNGGNGEFPYW
jgi:hypothetical protein